MGNIPTSAGSELSPDPSADAAAIPDAATSQPFPQTPGEAPVYYTADGAPYSEVPFTLGTVGSRPFDLEWQYTADASRRLVDAQMAALSQNARNSEELARVTHDANHDDLTGLYNRGAFSEIYQKLVPDHDQRRHKGAHRPPATFMFLDVDNFKAVNSTDLQHTLGDVALRRIAELLRQELRESDIICRMGGDEFAVLMPDTNTNNAETIAARLLEKVADINGSLARPVKIGFSIGIAPALPDLKETYERADFASGFSKDRKGKNSFTTYGELVFGDHGQTLGEVVIGQEVIPGLLQGM